MRPVPFRTGCRRWLLKVWTDKPLVMFKPPRPAMARIRLLPLVIAAAVVLLLYKSVGLVADGAGVLTGAAPASAQVETSEADADGDMETPLSDNGADAAQTQAATVETVDGEVLDFNPSQSEPRLLERLGERREELEAREQELAMREQLLEVAEQRLEEQLVELERVQAELNAVREAEEQRQSEDIGRLVAMYQAMRPKDAGAIFDLLELPILLEVARAMNPRNMADIMANMTPESARRLTIALAGQRPRSEPAPQEDPGLPRIEGVPVQ